MHIGTQEESLFASLSIWIIIVIPAPWNFDQWEDRVYLHLTCINNFGPFRNFAVWMRTAPTIKSNIVIILIPISEQSNRSTGVKTP